MEVKVKYEDGEIYRVTVAVNETYEVRVTKEVIAVYDQFKTACYEFRTNPPEPDLSPVKEPAISMAEILENRKQTESAKRMKNDPITEFWFAWYENIRNIVKNFWR